MIYNLTQKDKELLLKDLSARLTYGVKAYVKNWSKLDRKWYEGVYTVESIQPYLNDILVCSERGSVKVILGYDDYEIKPYLFPLSSMTEEQLYELREMFGFEIEFGDGFIELSTFHHGRLGYLEMDTLFEWFYRNHFDYRGLIPLDLAIDATGLNIY